VQCVRLYFQLKSRVIIICRLLFTQMFDQDKFIGSHSDTCVTQVNTQFNKVLNSL
jgi:hypothetical protein